MFFLEIDLPPVLDRGLHLDLFGGAPVVEIGPNFWGARNETKTQPPTCGKLQLLTDTYSPGNWGMLLMGCVRASSAPDGSRRHPETTHEVLLFVPCCERVERKARKKLFVSSEGA